MDIQTKEQWGLLTSINLYECDKQLITNEVIIKQFIIELCELINMTRYGEPIIVYFAKHDPKVAGYTLVQLIETSCVTAHFVDINGNVYIDVFSCKDYNSEKLVEYCSHYFNAKDSIHTITKR